MSKTEKWLEAPRADGRMEWKCKCGIGHGNHIHSCCGCCQHPDYPGKLSHRDRLLLFIAEALEENWQEFDPLGRLEDDCTALRKLMQPVQNKEDDR